MRNGSPDRFPPAQRLQYTTIVAHWDSKKVRNGVQIDENAAQ